MIKNRYALVFSAMLALVLCFSACSGANNDGKYDFGDEIE